MRGGGFVGRSLRAGRLRRVAEVNATPATVLDGIDAVRGAVGRHLGFSGWLIVTQAQIDRFVEAAGEHQWTPVDVDRGRLSPTPKGTIAPGFLVLSLSNLFLPQVVDVRGFSVGVNYGMDEVRFPAPAPVGSRLRGSAELLAVADIPGGVQTSMRITIERKGARRPACVIDSISRYLL